MALVQIYAGDTKTIVLQFTDNTGAGLNVSGYGIRGVAKRNYSDDISQAILNTIITGIDSNAVTGIVYFPITTGNTTQCPGNYLLDFYITDLFSGRATFPTDGLSILPTNYP